MNTRSDVDPTRARPILVDRDARDRIARDLDATLIVEAAAGTGKTTALVGRIMSLVASGKTSLGKIVAVTFTEAAAGEMKLRLRSELEAARRRIDTYEGERQRLDRALFELETARIGTIHSFCADLLSEWPVEALVDPEFEVSASAERTFDAAFDPWFEEVLADPPEGIRRVLRRPTRDRDSVPPREVLRRAALDLIEHRDYDAPWSNVSLDRPAEIDRIIIGLAELAAFSALAGAVDSYLKKNLEEIARFVAELAVREHANGRDYDGLEADLRTLSRLRSWGWKGSGSSYAPGVSRARVADARDRVKRDLSAALARCDAHLAACLREELRPLLARYEREKARRGSLDFLDLLLFARNLVRDHAHVRASLSERISHILVDEFQDTDPLQAELLILLAASPESTSSYLDANVVRGKLFVVGDPKQSIYRFRRADVALYERIKRSLISQGASLVHLRTNFRSTQTLQNAVNAAFASQMTGGDDARQAAYVAIEPSRSDRPGQPHLVALPVPKPYADWGKATKFAIEASLPDAVAAFIDFLVKDSGWMVVERGESNEVPIAPRHICLLFKRLQSFGQDALRPYVRALEARRIPHVLVGGRSFHTREEVIAVRNVLAAVEWPDDELSVYATLRGPFFAFSDDALLAYKSVSGSLSPAQAQALGETRETGAAHVSVRDALRFVASLHRRRNRRPIADTVAEFLEHTRAHAGIAIWPTGEQALGNVLRIIDLARRFEKDGGLSFRGFIARLEDDARRGAATEAPVVEEGTEGVRMMSIHRAKGLEFAVVVLADPTAPETSREPSRFVDADRNLCAIPLAGCVPQELAERRDDVLSRDRAEAVRLAYVAATRARDLLVVPVVGDDVGDDVLSFGRMLDDAVYPDRSERRRSRAAAMCPRFGEDSVLARPNRVEARPADSVRPGLHRARVGGHSVVWWDPAVLELDREPDLALRQQKILEADDGEVQAREGERGFGEWKALRQRVLSVGATPSARVSTVTAFSKKSEASSSDVAVMETDVDRVARPGGKRFGTLVHAVLSQIALHAEHGAIVARSELSGRLLGAHPEEIHAATNAVERALCHPIFERAKASTDVRRECPVAIARGDGEIVEGVVDLAYLDGGEWVVVDFKTDAALLEANVASYKVQIGLYAEAIAQATQKPARGVLLRV